MAIFARNSGNMEQFKQINIEAFNYELPEERIPRFPLSKRDTSRLLQYKNGAVTDHVFGEITDLLPENTLMFFNNSKVIRARLEFFKTTGARIEIFCLEPHQPAEHQLAFQAKGESVWKCMVGNLKKWKQGEVIREFAIEGKSYRLMAEYLGPEGKDHLIKFRWSNDFTFATVIEICGRIPIPPYLKRDSQESDLQTYQTVYAKVKGSVAAPTAGLHFTPEVLDDLAKKGIQQEEVTLHVGAGTFQPVKDGAVGDHEMHAENIIVNRQTILNLKAHNGVVVPVGTTSVRTLESLYWLGVKMWHNPELESKDLQIEQWDPYEKAHGSAPDKQDVSLNDALQAILNWLERNDTTIIQAVTRIMIAPGYRYRIAGGIVTNFHQPKSTLLLLVCAAIGNDWKRVYEHALANDYRFLSYGDSSLLWVK